ncbi:MAG: hypothetical protein KDK60_00055 [Chlamydiia bacterium]|nr:hypothetical protein [Chlamydiia bacterium]
MSFLGYSFTFSPEALDSAILSLTPRATKYSLEKELSTIRFEDKGIFIPHEDSSTFGHIHSISPSLEEEKLIIADHYPILALDEALSSPISLDMEDVRLLTMSRKRPFLRKYSQKRQGSVTIQEKSLPIIKGKKVITDSLSATPKKILEDVPTIQSLAFRHHHSIEREAIVPMRQSDTGAAHLLEKEPFYSFSNYENMGKEDYLAFLPLDSSPAFNEIPSDCFEIPPPKKQLMPPHDLKDALAADRFKIPIDQNFIEEGISALDYAPVPKKAPLVMALSPSVLPHIETDMVRSQSKEILEDYNQENAASHQTIALAIPKMQCGPNEEETQVLNQSSRFTSAFLTQIPHPSQLETISYQDEFETVVHYSPKEEGQGYLFALKIKPKPNTHFAPSPQNYVFIIDGSSTIKKHRFATFKEGVRRALPYLREGDSFNILIADATLRPLEKEPVKWDQQAIAHAKHFLSKQGYKGFFTKYDPFDLLSEASKHFHPDKENVVVLLSDGHNFKSFQHHKEDFQELSRASQGRFSIFTATSSQDNNLAMLDLVSTFNDGELMYSKTNVAFSRQLAKLVKHIHHFVAKAIHVNLTHTRKGTNIAFYPTQQALPSYFSDRPYTIYGEIDRLDDFNLILQGKAGDHWINIQQPITFKNAEKATTAIKRGMVLQKSYVCFDRFLEHEDSIALIEGEQLQSSLHRQ